MNKKSLITGAVAAVGMSAIGIGAVSAFAASNSGSDSGNSLVNAIAQKFNLKPSDVQAVVDQQRQKDQASRAQRAKTTLDQAVKDGTITQAQEDLIIAKQTELQNFLASLKGKTELERQAALTTEKDSLMKWAADNKIPIQYLHFMGGRHGPKGMNEVPETSDPVDK